MPRYAALLRGVSPMNAKMSELREAFEVAGFSDVKTVLASGNVVFSSTGTSISALQKKCEAAMMSHIGSSFATIVRSIRSLEEIIADDPYARFRLAPGSKRIVTFLATPPVKPPKLPVEQDGARILTIVGGEVFSAYTATPKGPVFMTLIEKTFGKSVTTRTWDTVQKIVRV